MMKRRWSNNGGFANLRMLEESSSEVTSSSNGLVLSTSGIHLSPSSLDSPEYDNQDWLYSDAAFNPHQHSVITSVNGCAASLPAQTTIIPLPALQGSNGLNGHHHPHHHHHHQNNNHQHLLAAAAGASNGLGGGAAAAGSLSACLTNGLTLGSAAAMHGLSINALNGGGSNGSVGSGVGGILHNGFLHGVTHQNLGQTLMGLTQQNSLQSGLQMNNNNLNNNSNHNNSSNHHHHHSNNNNSSSSNNLMQHTPRSDSANSVSSGRDDLSPSSSLNGYSEGCDAKKSKKGPAPRLQEELCLVCGDRASGYHYNALTCEGCKGFFRRSVTKNAVYCCKFGHACEMDMYMRRKCQECRLKKCLAVGMRPECVVPENQCAMKRREKKAQKEKDKQQASPSAVSTTEFIKKEILELMICEPPTHPTCPLLPDELLVANQARNIPSLTINQLAVIYKLIWYQDGYEQPSEEDLKRIMISSPDENESQHDISFRHITEITILTVQLIVEFAKGLPAFTKIPQEDQITLLKACSSEVMMLRMARRYDHASDSIFFANNRSYTRESYKMAGMADNIEDLLHFCRQMFSMKVDNVEYALLTAIVIFSDRPGLEEAELVEAIQSYYIDTLRIYILNRHCGDPKSLVFFAKLLSILTELRTLGNQNAEMCFSLKLKNRKLPKFLEEIWDVHAIPPSVQSHIQAMQAERAAQEPSCEAASTSSAAAAAACSSSTSSASGAASSASTSTSTSASSSTTVAPTSSGLNGDDEVRIVGVNTLYGAALTTTTPMSTTVTPGLNLMGVSLGQDHHMLGGTTHSTVA